MPTRFEMQYARPLCHQGRMERMGQHGWHYTWYTTMRYERAANQW